MNQQMTSARYQTRKKMDVQIRFVLTSDDQKLIRKAAKQADLAVNAWLRKVAREAAGRELV